MSVSQDPLLHGEALFVIASTDCGQHIPSTPRQEHPETSAVMHFLQKVRSLCSSSTSISFWQPVAGKKMSSFMVSAQLTSDLPRERTPILISKLIHSIGEPIKYLSNFLLELGYL
uniref:Uncharacterized protein n=1 Tax=Podarcis muralis TaxID=64176 RepID=A0A670HZC7_PODMU